MTTSPSAYREFFDSREATACCVIDCTRGLIEVTMCQPPRRSESSRSCAVAPNAGCCSHHCLNSSQKNPQSLCALDTETQSLGGVSSLSRIGCFSVAVASADEM